MTDVIGFVIQGLFTGIGAGAALWFNERHLRKRLDKISDQITKVKKEDKDGN